MNIPLTAKSDGELSSNSSWSVISESDDSEFTSEGKRILESDTDNKYKNIKETEDHFFDICENNKHETTEESENEDRNRRFVCFDHVANEKKFPPVDSKSKNIKPKSKKLKKNRQNEKADSLSLLSIAASVLTITGITFLCMLFPQNLDTDTLQSVQKTYVDVITNKNASAENFLNKTTEMYDVLNEADFFNKMKDIQNKEHFMKEEICPIDEISNESFDSYGNFDSYPIHFVTPPKNKPSDMEKQNSEFKHKPLSQYQQVQNKTFGLIKNAKRLLMDPNLQIFVCTILQDICLIKLVNQLNKQQSDKSTDSDETCKEKVNIKSKTKKGTRINKLKSKQNVKTNKNLKTCATTDINKIKNSSEDIVGISKSLNEGTNDHHIVKLHLKRDIENGEKECERRFEELDSKWEAAALIHRQKIQEIKENFKNEIFHIKENEREYSLRTQKIQLLREKYIERLKYDREKYLRRLQKLREERGRILKSICHQKSNEVNSKDASVGNYAILLPESYDFQQKLQLLKNQNHETPVSLPSVPTASFPKLGAVKNSNFIKFQSIPNIPKQEMLKPDSDSFIKSVNAKTEKYFERVRDYYEKKNKYLQKKAMMHEEQNSKQQDSTSKIAETISEALIEDIMSHMVTEISEKGKGLHSDSSASSIETVKPSKSTKNSNISVETPTTSHVSAAEIEMGNVKREFKLIVKRKPKKQDLYDVAFERKSKKVKQGDRMKWSIEHKETLHKLPQQQMLAKQDPQKAYKEKIVIKGHI